MGYDELLICWRSSRRKELCKLGEAESGQHGSEVGVVGEVEVECLVKRECAGIVVDGDIGLTCGCVQGVVVHSSQELFDISYANCAAGR